MKKIPTLFKRVFEDGKVVGVKNIITEGCEEVFLHGKATLKIDGSCCAVINGEFYRRYDAKHGKPVPDGAIKCQEEADPITGHLPCWVKCDRNKPDDKWFWAAFDAYSEEKGEPENGTYEAIGKHFRNNPYGLTVDTLAKHGEVGLIVDRTFEGVERFLEENEIEGIVFWLNGEPICKIKRSDFNLPWNRK